jgi:uncharacterized protein with HEPN domain
MNLRDSVRLNHILDSLKDLMVIFNEVSTVEQFLTHRLYKHASVRHLEIIGEACGYLLDKVQKILEEDVTQ